MNLLILIIIEYALNLFQNDVINRIDKKNELTRKDILLRSIILAIAMTFIGNLTKSLGPIGIAVIFLIAYFAAFFRQIYLSRNINLTTAFERNLKLLENNRLTIILIISRILVGIFEIYKKILASIIFLNVENNQ